MRAETFTPPGSLTLATLPIKRRENFAARDVSKKIPRPQRGEGPGVGGVAPSIESEY